MKFVGDVEIGEEFLKAIDFGGGIDFHLLIGFIYLQ